MHEFIHFVGLGGIGVSALAQIAQARHAMVSGSDAAALPESNPALARLIEHGATYYRGHSAANLAEGVTLVVATAAVGDGNPEIAAARARGIRLVSRAEYLGELMAAHHGPTIAIAGTHGKTTTTGMIGVMLAHAGMDPTILVGGESPQVGGNVRIGSPTGPFVAEACEAYDSFLQLRPNIAIVTNVEADHLDHYGTEAGVFAAFRKFLGGVADGGYIVACADDEGVQRLLREDGDGLKDRTLLYGIDRVDCAASAVDLELGERPVFTLRAQASSGRTSVKLAVPGRHNVENALAAAVIGMVLQMPMRQIAAGIGEFQGVGRRQDRLGELQLDGGAALLIDDYAHHPTEIRATLDALRSAYPDRRLVAVFQPHLYSRTRDFLADFARELSRADSLFVTDIYAAREEPIAGVEAAEIVRLARRERPLIDAQYIADKRELPDSLFPAIRPRDVVVFMGAGDIREQGEALLQRIRPLEAVC